MAKSENWNLMEDFYDLSTQISHLYSAPIPMTDKEKLNAAGMRLMEAVVMYPGANMSELSNLLAVTKGATSQMAIKLQESGLLEKRSVAGRDIQLTLTKKGKRIYNKQMKQRQELGEAMLASFSDIPAETLTELHHLIVRSKKYIQEVQKAEKTEG